MTYSPTPLHPSAANNVILERLAYRIFNYVMKTPELLPYVVNGDVVVACEALSYHLDVPLEFIYRVEADVVEMVRAAGALHPSR